MKQAHPIAAALALLALFSTPLVHAADDAVAALGKRLFMQDADPACSACHTLKDADAQGEYGPLLDGLKASPERVTAALRTGGEIMPSYKKTLTEAQIQALARYVSVASGWTR